MATITKLKGKFKGEDKKAERESLKNIKQANKEASKRTPKEYNRSTSTKISNIKSKDVKIKTPKRLLKTMQQERNPKFQKSI